jgi:1-acyl-sn-glycerol-3-phosphate acyltransferase
VSKNGPTYNASSAAVQLATERFIVRPFYTFFKKLSVSGRENIPKDRPMLVVSNHLSLWDPPILSVATQKPICYIAKKELFDNAYLAKLIEVLGTVAIDRKKPTLSSIKKIKEAIKAGWSVGIFIEGTRSKIPGSLGQPHTGAAYFAHANKLPILPVGLVDTNKKGEKCYARIGEIIEPGPDLEAKTWEIMQALSGLTGYKLPHTRKVEQE